MSEKEGIIAIPRHPGYKGGPFDHQIHTALGKKDGEYIPGPDEDLLPLNISPMPVDDHVPEYKFHLPILPPLSYKPEPKEE